MFHSHYAHKKQDWNYDVTALFRPHQDISAVCSRSVQNIWSLNGQTSQRSLGQKVGHSLAL